MGHAHNMKFFWFLGILSILASTALSLDLVGHVQWNDICLNYEALGPARVMLDTGRYSGRVTRSGNFSIPDVVPGTYVLSVLSHDYVFEQVRVDVSDSSPIPEIKSYIIGTPLTSHSSVSLPYPVVLTPRHKNSYFKPRDSFNLLGMFQNPMMMIMVLTGVMMLGMPYIMKNLDPQTLEELKGQQGKIANFQNSMQNGDLKSGLSALLAAEEESKASAMGPKPPVNGSTMQQRKVGKGSRRR
ncbi:hypothetical protein HYDPIDRAFT_106426 [Hydnomerulius pinastri MD-312]|nr:hypothetical protein HYDPIDRAFT_106426 [Hydnomerulius pinastri MD-312]